MHVLLPEFLQKEPSSFRCYGKSFITYMLRPEGCFRHLSA
ncbi:hypothetical protein HMPREF9441_02665 [Paraprevotella clara YIT 11840]|uniref:Uncharacterized protein n=1 Tax=Paraprevotella clara YIT 11840 TaxID=762968 RepID=G5STG2_9BACT|nr:hypothetical protein HMPREF9441_02665 [Paraprevotella clara YIT 11840]